MKNGLLITDNTSALGWPPRYLGPYRVAHGLEMAGLRTHVLDHFYSFEKPFKVIERLVNRDTIFVGISTTFFTPPAAYAHLVKGVPQNELSDTYHRAIMIDEDPELVRDWFVQLRQLLSEKAPQAKIIVGGAKALRFLAPPYGQINEIDYVVAGVVDQVFPQMIEDLMSKGEISHVIKNGIKVADTMGTYHQPKVCPPHQWLMHWGIQKGEALPIEIARGCAFNCKFCNYAKQSGIRKSAEQLRDELLNNYENWGTTFYHFTDDCINDSRGKVEMLHSVISSLPFKMEWVSYARMDVAVRFPETFKMLIDSGARGLYFGIESLTYEVARRAGKGTPPDAIKKFLLSIDKETREHCILTGSLITGLPGETEESWSKEFDWLMENETFDYLHIGPLRCRPYIEEFDQKVIDFADYSRNPQKYGFEELRFSPEYWRHSTMDSVQADALARESMKLWTEKSAQRRGLFNDMWVYPHLRSLGFSPKESRDIFFNASEPQRSIYRTQIRNRVLARREDYFRIIESVAGDFSNTSRGNDSSLVL